MKTTTKRKLGAVGLRTLGLGSAVGIPVVVVLQKFPLWGSERVVDGKTLGVGGVMALLIVLVGFRRQLWPVVKTKLHITAIGALIFWGLAFGLLLGIERMVPLLPDLRTVCIAGLTGTALGQGFDTAAGIGDPAKGETARNGQDKEVAKDA